MPTQSLFLYTIVHLSLTRKKRATLKNPVLLGCTQIVNAFGFLLKQEDARESHLLQMQQQRVNKYGEAIMKLKKILEN